MLLKYVRIVVCGTQSALSPLSPFIKLTHSFDFSVSFLQLSGEYLAIAVSFEHMSETTKNARAAMLGKTLNKAIERLLENQKSPGRKVCCVFC